jgi:hypothetical protein
MNYITVVCEIILFIYLFIYYDCKSNITIALLFYKGMLKKSNMLFELWACGKSNEQDLQLNKMQARHTWHWPKSS